MILKGICACKGKASAKAFVIEDISSVPEVPDAEYILVAPYTTPVLNMLILNSKGIICERGGMTCHAAVIAREFSIPCVLGINNATTLVRQGQNISINNGEVIYE